MSLQIVEIPVGELHPSPWNPNEMTDEQFNNLVKNLRDIGLVQPIQVHPRPEGGYVIIGGEHRWKAARHLGWETVPCVVHEGWDEDRQKFVNMRMNVIAGKISPAKFTRMYMEMLNRYSKEILQQMMGFQNEEEMQRLVKQVGAGLTPDQRRELNRSRQEIRNVSDLTEVLHRIMREHGNTLEHGFITFVYGGKTCLMIQMDNALKRVMESIGDRCVRQGLDLRDVLTSHLLRVEVGDGADSQE